jgi:hypothetical protein
MARLTAPVVFGRKMKRVRTYGYGDIWMLNVGPLCFSVWQVNDGVWRGTSKFGHEVITAVLRKTRPGIVRSLESGVRSFSRKLSKLTNSQEGDEVR